MAPLPQPGFVAMPLFGAADPRSAFAPPSADATARRPHAGRFTLRRFARLLGALAIASVIVSTAAGRLFPNAAWPGAPAHVEAAVREPLDGLARALGFGIDMVVLSGHRFTPDSDIYDALDLTNARSLVSFDTEGVRRRLERLPWIERADVLRVFPDRLDVRVTERRAFAVWRRGQSLSLIDRTGRVLGAIARDQGLDLPRVAGEGAAGDAEALLNLIALQPNVASRLEEAERVGGRRWTLRLAGGVVLHLPPDREAQVLQSIGTGGTMAALISEPQRVIDLRVPGRIAITPLLAAGGARTEIERGPG